jgi:hypothetical protein
MPKITLFFAPFVPFRGRKKKLISCRQKAQKKGEYKNI